MRKSNFVSLARLIADHNARCLATFGGYAGRMSFSPEEIRALADWCESQAKPGHANKGEGFKREVFIAMCNGQKVGK
jgi:hypothetical protein